MKMKIPATLTRKYLLSAHEESHCKNMHWTFVVEKYAITQNILVLVDYLCHVIWLLVLSFPSLLNFQSIKVHVYDLCVTFDSYIVFASFSCRANLFWWRQLYFCLHLIRTYLLFQLRRILKQVYLLNNKDERHDAENYTSGCNWKLKTLQPSAIMENFLPLKETRIYFAKIGSVLHRTDIY